MPLIKGKSKKAFSKNVATEMEAGQPQKRALAIAYATKRRAGKKKMASGGTVESGSKDMNLAYGGVTGGYAPGENQQDHGAAKPGYGNLGYGSDGKEAARSPKSPMTTADEAAKARAMLGREHARDACMGPGCPGCMAADCYAHGGVAGESYSGVPSLDPGYGSMPGEGPEAGNRMYPDSEGKMQRMAKQDLGDSAGYEGIADRIRKRYMMAEGGKVGGPYTKETEDGYTHDIRDEMEHLNYEDDRSYAIGDEKTYDNDISSEPWDSNEDGDDLKDEDEHSKSMFKKIKMKRAQPGDRGNY